MPGRIYSSGYRYNYQGQEDAVNSNWQAFELRMHNSDLGRWFAPDPYGQFFSPYVSMGNNPVSGVDPDGGYYAGYGSSGNTTSANKSAKQKHEEVAKWYESELASLYTLRYNGYLDGGYAWDQALAGLNAQRAAMDNAISNEGYDFEDKMIRNRLGGGDGAFGAMGSEAFADVDAGRFKWAQIGDAKLNDIMSRRWTDTYEVKYFATMDDYENNLNGVFVGTSETKNGAFKLGDIYVELKNGFKSDAIAGVGGYAKSHTVEEILRIVSKMEIGTSLSGSAIASLSSNLEKASWVLRNIERTKEGHVVNLTIAGRTALKLAPNVSDIHGSVFNLKEYKTKLDGITGMEVSSKTAMYDNKPLLLFFNDNQMTTVTNPDIKRYWPINFP